MTFVIACLAVFCSFAAATVPTQTEAPLVDIAHPYSNGLPFFPPQPYGAQHVMPYSGLTPYSFLRSPYVQKPVTYSHLGSPSIQGIQQPLLGGPYSLFYKNIWAQIQPGVKTCNDIENAVNAYRQRSGLSALPCHDKPRYVARMHSYDQTDAEQGTSCGDNWHDWRTSKYACGSPCKSAFGSGVLECHMGKSFNELLNGWGEIITQSVSSASASVTSWKNSPGHNKIMLDTKWEFFGCDKSHKYANCNFYSHW